MHVAVTGSSGLIGSQLVPALTGGGHTVTRLVRRLPRAADEARWDPEVGTVDTGALRDADAVIHLAGESLTMRPWTREYKRRLRDSRVEGTRLVAEAVAGLDDGPRTLVCASGTHYYGDRGDETLDETSSPGEGFFTEVVRDWEAAADPARQAGVRVVHVRTGIVQDPAGGALQRMLPLFRLGLGGPFGRGRQWWSWVARDDVIGIFSHALTSEDVAGPINATAPAPVTNAEYTRVLARVLGRPAVLPVPPVGPKLLLGPEGAKELLFTSARVRPAVAEQTGYAFRQPELEPALREVLGRPAAPSTAA